MREAELSYPEDAAGQEKQDVDAVFRNAAFDAANRDGRADR